MRQYVNILTFILKAARKKTTTEYRKVSNRLLYQKLNNILLYWKLNNRLLEFRRSKRSYYVSYIYIYTGKNNELTVMFKNFELYFIEEQNKACKQNWQMLEITK